MMRLLHRSAAMVLAGALWAMGAPSSAMASTGMAPNLRGQTAQKGAAQKGAAPLAPKALADADAAAPALPGDRPESSGSRAGSGGDWLELVLGATIDLEDLDFADPEKTHATVGRAAGEAIALRPGPGVRFGSVRRGPASPDDVSTWEVPAASDSSLRENRTALLRAGDSLFFALPDGRVGRLEVSHDAAAGWWIRRDLAATGQSRIPRPPARPVRALVDPGSGLVMVSVPKVRPPESASRMIHEVQAERPVGSGQWTTVDRFRPGQHEGKILGLFGAGKLEDTLAPNAVARIRVRRGLEGESLSTGGPATDLVVAAGDLDLRRQAARLSVASLIDADFQVRLEASLALGLLGAEAREALDAAIGGEGIEGDGDVSQAARERLRVLDAAESGGPDFPLRLAQAARAAAIADRPDRADRFGAAFDHPPRDLVAGDPLERAAAILRLIDRSERGARPMPLAEGSGAADLDVARDCAVAVAWASAMAELDPDPSVRQLCAFFGRLRVQPSIGAFEAPVQGWLLHDVARAAGTEFEPFANPRDPLPAQAADLIFELSAREELGDRRVGPALARIRAYLVAAEDLGDQVSITPESGYHDYDADLVELGLRLVERAVREPLVARKKELLSAVEALLPGPELTFAAWRESTDRRWASPLGAPGAKPPGGVDGRREVLLGDASLGALEQALLDLALDAGALGSASRMDVDILLPGGEYGEFSKRPRILDVPASGIRILPADPRGKVVIHAGFRCMGAVDFVLQNVTVAHGAGQAITVMDGGHAVAIGSTLKGKGRVIHISSGEVELYECAALPAVGDPNQGTMLQLMGQGRFAARASILRAGSLFIGQGGGEIWLDRCVLDAADRPIVQGQLGGRLITRESLLRGDGAGLMSVEKGMLAATVLEAAFQPLGRGGSGLMVSPGLFALTGSREDSGKVERFAVEPLPVK